MTEHLTKTGFDALDQAIQTVIHDPRVPKTLRTALGVYQDQRAVLNNRETDVMRAGQTEAACLIEIYIWRNDESFDWSVEINGQRTDHVTSDLMEGLVECAMIRAERLLMGAFSHRSQ
jgi:hypothetical protein